MTSKGESSSQLICHEQYGASTKKRDFRVENHGGFKMIDRSKNHNSLKQLAQDVFLPQGYPDSVSKDYMSYQIWDTVQAFASSITGTLAAHAVLKGVGVGDEKATVMAATITWLLKDGAGMLGRILFAWTKGTGLDCDAKRWRLFADFLNDFAIFLSILAPSFGSYFIAVMCVVSICTSIVGVAGGCTRAALTLHQARRNNMADVSAKDGSQETMVNLLALVCNLALVPVISGNLFIVWPLFSVFTLLHITANYKAVRSVCMETINQARLHFIVSHFLQSENKDVPSVEKVNKLEPVFLPVSRPLTIRLGVSWSEIMGSGIPFDTLKGVYEKSMTDYILVINFKKKTIDIALSSESKSSDQIQACFHAELINFIIANKDKSQDWKKDLLSMSKLIQDCQSAKTESKETMKSLLSTSLHFTEIHVSDLTYDLLEKGWVTDTTLLGPEEWRATWNFSGLSDKKVA